MKINGKILAERRIGLLLTMGELAKAVGVSATAIGRWEAGGTIPRIKHLKKLCSVLLCDVEYLTLNNDLGEPIKKTEIKSDVVTAPPNPEEPRKKEIEKTNKPASVEFAWFTENDSIKPKQRGEGRASKHGLKNLRKVTVNWLNGSAHVPAFFHKWGARAYSCQETGNEFAVTCAIIELESGEVLRLSSQDFTFRNDGY